MSAANEGGSDIEERLVDLRRCSKVVKGGRNFSFSALVCVGDRHGRVGFGLGKAREASDAIRKGGEVARRNMVKVSLRGGTIPHEISAKYRGGRVVMRPAAPGTGLIAGGGMRAVLALAGVQDVLAKSLGSSNPINVVKATMQAVQGLNNKSDIEQKRGLSRG